MGPFDAIHSIAKSLVTIAQQLVALNATSAIIAEQTKRVADALLQETPPDPNSAVGVALFPDTPTTHGTPSTKAQPHSARTTAMKAKCTKKTHGAMAPQKARAGAGLVEFNLQDNGDDTFTVLGVDAAGNTLDISSVATMTVSSDNTSVLTVDPPSGMTSAMHAIGPIGTATITAVVTWNDGSVGPFTVSLPVTTVVGGATGVQIQPGTPSVH